MTKVTKKRLDTAMYPCYSINNNNKERDIEMETQARRSVYAPQPNHGGYLSVTQIKNHNADIGHNFFKYDTLRFFSSKVYDDLIGGEFFITSEQDRYTDGARLFTIRQAKDDGTIVTVGDFQAYKTKAQALKEAKKLV